MNSNENRYDDLTIISGIGPARQQWLRDTFGVQKYEDLAGLSVDEIESNLKAEGKIASRSAIETWIHQANELVTSVSLSKPVLNSVNNEINKGANSLGNGVNEDWRPFASFVVEFQTQEIVGKMEEYRTAVHYMEADRGTNWNGIESKQLCQWMLDQIQDKVKTVEQEIDRTQPQVEEKPSIDKEGVKVNINAIRFFQPPQSEVSKDIDNNGNGPSSVIVNGNQPLRILVDFELIGSAAENVTRSQIEYNLRVFAYDQDKQESILLREVESNTFKEGVLSYSIKIPEISLPPGKYRLWVMVTPEGGLVVPDYLEVSKFIAA